MEEEWVPIPNFEGYYCNKSGEIASKKNRKNYQQLTITTKTKQTVKLTVGKKASTYDVHFLVASTFLPNPENCKFVRHLNGMKCDNRPENLRWMNHEEAGERDLAEEIKDAELWRPIKKCSGYLISRHGELVSRKTKKCSLIKPNAGSIWTTYRIKFDGDRVRSTVPVQLLLGLVFLPNPEGHEFVAPKNQNLKDYRLENLHWWPNPNGIPETQWIPIRGFPNYEVSTLGVRNKSTKLLLKSTCESKDSYPQVTITNENGVEKTKRIHVLVAKHFHPNPEGLPLVNHLDGDHRNFSIENLKWSTHSQNLEHAYKTGLRDGSTSVTIELTGEEIWRVIDVCPDYEVSNTGAVRRIGSKFESRKLRLQKGYHILTLFLPNGKRVYHRVNRLVGFAFLTTDHLGYPLTLPRDQYEVDHKNKIRSDNRLENLQIMIKVHHKEKDQGKPVLALNLITNEARDFGSIASTSRAMGNSTKEISKAIQRQEAIRGWYYFLVSDPYLDAKVDFLMAKHK